MIMNALLAEFLVRTEMKRFSAMIMHGELILLIW